VCEHRELVHDGEVQSKAMRCAAVGPRPRWVTFDHVDTPGDHQLEDRVAEDAAGDLRGHRAYTGNLAHLISLGPAAHQGVKIHPQQGQEAGVGARRSPWWLVADDLGMVGRAGLSGGGLGIGLVRRGHRRFACRSDAGRTFKGTIVDRPGVVAAGAAGELEEGVERVGIPGFAPAVTSGGPEDLVDDRVERRVDNGTGVGSAAALEIPSTLAVGPTTQAALTVDTAIRRVRVGIGGCLGPIGLLA